MTDKKLTPRVGDRVLVVDGGRTKVGNVHAFHGRGKYVQVDIDGWGVAGGFLTSSLTVVDREPVEWPEGWDSPEDFVVPTVRVDMACYMNRKVFDRIRGTEGDYVAAHWDELVGGGA